MLCYVYVIRIREHWELTAMRKSENLSVAAYVRGKRFRSLAYKVMHCIPVSLSCIRSCYRLVQAAPHCSVHAALKFAFECS